MAKITKEIVLEVKRYMEKYPNLSQNDIAKLAGCSQASVSDIKAGHHDHLLIDAEATNEEKSEDHIPEVKKMEGIGISYEALQELVVCKFVLCEMFASMKLSNTNKETLFIDYRMVSKILKELVPWMYNARLKELGGVCDGTDKDAR